MEAQHRQVEYEGIVYPSIKAFADAYQLNYPKATTYFRKGKTPEEVIQKCQFSTASKTRGLPPETPKRQYVEYNGVQYMSIYAAAEALGISPAQVYSVKQRKHYTPEAAIEYVLEHSVPAGGASNHHLSKPCVIEGIEYPSREAALVAYRQKRITVYSRMKREKISFEEAVVRGRKTALYRKPTSSLFPQLHLIHMNKDLTSPKTLADLTASFSYYNCRVVALMDMLTGTPALLVDDQTYLCYNEEARGIEIITELDFTLDDEAVNVFNESYITVKLFRSKARGKLILAAFQSAKSEGQCIEPLLNAWFSYTTIRDILLRRFSPEQMLATPEKKLGKEKPAEV